MAQTRTAQTFNPKGGKPMKDADRVRLQAEYEKAHAAFKVAWAVRFATTTTYKEGEADYLAARVAYEKARDAYRVAWLEDPIGH